MNKPACATSPIQPEYTLCGRAFDDTDSEEGPPKFAQSGQKITCKDCLQVISYCKSLKGNLEQ